ncbi:MAG TPA: flagellar basal body protein, partial [Fontimonas sp.]
MSSLRIFDIAGSAMSAQSVRLNTVASNLANADAVAGSAEEVYKARLPVFKALAAPGTDT